MALTAGQLDSILRIVNILIPLGLSAGRALTRAIRATHGDLPASEFEAIRAELEQDATIRAALSRADAAGG